MHIKTGKRTLSRAVDLAMRAVPSSGQAWMKRLVLDASNEEREDGRVLSVTGGVGALVIRSGARALVHEPGRVFLPSDEFSEIVSRLPDADGGVELQVQDNFLRILAQDFDMQLTMLAEDDWAGANLGDQNFHGVVDARLLTEMLSHILVGASNKEEPGDHLAGIAIRHSKDGLYLASTTMGHRGTSCRIPWEEEVQEASDAICVLARTSVDALEKLLDRALDRCAPNTLPVMLRLGNRAASFVCGGDSLVSSLINTSYPNVWGMLPNPDAMTVHCRVDRKTMVNALRRAQTVAKRHHDDAFKDAVALQCGHGRVVVLAESPAGRTTEPVEADCEGEMQLGIHAPYLAAALASIEDDEVTIHLREKTPALLPSGNGCLHWIMLRNLK